MERFPGFSVLAGADPLMLPLLRKGGAGCITATSNLMAKDLAFVYRHFADADRAAEVEAAQARVVAERNRTAGPVQIATIKALTAARTGQRRLAPDAAADGAALGRAGGRLAGGRERMRTTPELVDALGGIVGRQHVIAADDDQEPYLVDWRGRYHGRARGGGEAGEHGTGRGRGPALRRGRACAWCPRAATPACAAPPRRRRTGAASCVRLDRMNRVRAVEPARQLHHRGGRLHPGRRSRRRRRRRTGCSRSASAPRGAARSAATSPPTPAARRCCATAPTRELVLGLEVVLPDGTVLDRLQRAAQGHQRLRPEAALHRRRGHARHHHRRRAEAVPAPADAARSPWWRCRRSRRR